MPIHRKAKVVQASREVKVLNRLGLHARPAAEFVKVAQSFRSSIQIVLPSGEAIDAARIMDVLLANLGFGSVFVLRAEGPDAEKAVERMEKVLWELRDFDDVPAGGAGKDRPD
jgi:phosphocarrier protein HPr